MPGGLSSAISVPYRVWCGLHDSREFSGIPKSEEKRDVTFIAYMRGVKQEDVFPKSRRFFATGVAESVYFAMRSECANHIMLMYLAGN
jgi:hypothetical protein